MDTNSVLSEKEKEFIVEVIGQRYRYGPRDLYSIYNEPNALKRFYNSLVKKFSGLPTISPIHDPKWVQKAAEWLCQGEYVAEFGCGDGTFATKVLEVARCTIKEFYLIDFSEDVLERAKRSVEKFSKHDICKFRNWDIENISEVSGLAGKLDRIISINTLGDTRIDYALKEAKNLLKEGGLLRATLYSKETFDGFWAQETGKNYFTRSEFGMWFTPPDLYDGEYEPMGHIFIGKGSYQDFVRIQRYYTKDGWKKLLKECGFKVLRQEFVTYPPRIVMQRWGRKYGRRLKQYMKPRNGFPECYDVIAIKL